MDRLLNFFEIPAKNFQNLVMFYEELLQTRLKVYDWEEEQMAFFGTDKNGFYGSISKAANFEPSNSGVVIYFNADGELDRMIEVLEANKCKMIIPRTKIEAEGKGEFLVFIDPEGNKIGLHSN